MVREARQLYCDNEHGTGDVTFPDDGVFDWERFPSAEAVRKAARKEGWRRIQRADYCPSCVESMSDEY